MHKYNCWSEGAQAGMQKTEPSNENKIKPSHTFQTRELAQNRNHPGRKQYCGNPPGSAKRRQTINKTIAGET